MPVRSVLFLQPKPGHRQDLVDAFQRIDVFGHAMNQDGCVSIEMLAPSELEAALVVIALWTDRSGIEGWLNNPWRAESNEILREFIEGTSQSAIYDIILSVPEESAK